MLQKISTKLNFPSVLFEKILINGNGFYIIVLDYFNSKIFLVNAATLILK